MASFVGLAGIVWKLNTVSYEHTGSTSHYAGHPDTAEGDYNLPVQF